MNRKLHRVLDEIQKTKEKIAQWQEHLCELDAQREILEDAEIIKTMRSMKFGSHELLSVLEGLQDKTLILSEIQKSEEETEGNRNMGFLDQVETAGNGVPEATAPESEVLEDEKKD